MDAAALVSAASRAIDRTDLLLVGVDKLLQKAEDYLNRRKRRKLARQAEKLEHRLEQLELERKRIREACCEIIDVIEDLECRRRFRAGDVLTLGVSYAIRRAWLGAKQEKLLGQMDEIDRRVKRLGLKAVRIQQRIEYLRELATRDSPSFWARVIRFFRILFGLISSAVSFITGRLVSGLLSLRHLVAMV